MADQATNKQMETANQIFRRHDGILKTGEALSQGIHRRTLYAMRDEGVLERLDFPSIHIYWFSGEAFTAGVETRSIDRTTIHVYSVEKTLADCFKYRNKIGRTSRHACEQAPFEECDGFRTPAIAQYCHGALPVPTEPVQATPLKTYGSP